MIFPDTVLQTQIDALLAQLPAVRDADAEGVHAARVATRRLREALPLFVRSHPDDVERVCELVKMAGQRLGRVRVLDVMDEELARRAGRMPMAMHAIGAARRTVARRRDAARRRMIKTLDRLQLDGRGRLRLRPRGYLRRAFAGGTAHGWPEVLRARIASRAEDLRLAIDHAGGVYFPNRLHSLRVIIKKLRYSVELAGLSGLWHCEEAVGELKKAQETLGRIHDAQVLLESMDRLMGDDKVEGREVALLKGDLEGDIAERHAKYLAQRVRLREACTACADAAATRRMKRSPVGPLLLLSGVAVPAGLLLLGSRD
jgi:CHAD domain-containing protein